MHKHERSQPEARGGVDDPRQGHPTAPTAVVTVQPEAGDLPKGVKPLVALALERTVIPPGSKAARDSQAAPAEALPAYRKHESNGPCGVSFRPLERLLAIGKFVGCQKMQPDTIISGAYTAMSAAHAMDAITPAEILVATMYLVLATIHLIVPYQRKGDRPAR